MGSLFNDIRHTLRMLREDPVFSIAALAALTVGIGANTAIFSLINAVLLKPPPFPDSERIVMFMHTSPQGQGFGAAPAEFNFWRSLSDVTEQVAAFNTGVLNLTGGDVPEQLRSARVSADYFRLFGVPVIQGRSFTAQEDLPNGPRAALISEGLWRRRFGADTGILGKTLQLGGDPYVVVGVVGRGFDFRDFGPDPEVWVAFQLNPNSPDQGHYFQTAGRLKQGVTLLQARARVVSSATDYIRKYPGSQGQNGGFSIEPIRNALVQNVRQSLIVLAVAVGLVLLVACANVANLLLARALRRQREMAIRGALGAGRGRLIRQLLTESILLSAAGAALGSALGFIGIRALLSVNTAGLPRVGQNGALITVDWRVLLFTVFAAVVTAILFGLLPALQGSAGDLFTALKEGGSRSGSGFHQNRLRTVLVIGEIALALVLVIGAALLIRTSVALQAVRPGFDSHNVLTMRMSLAGNRFQKSTDVTRLIHDATERIRALPGVTAASATCCVPLEGGYGLPFQIIGRPLEKGPFHGGGGWLTVSPGYFEVFKIPVIRGRVFVDRDDASATPVVIINESMAKKFWPKGDPLRDRIWIGHGVMAEFSAEVPRQIVGIVGDVRDGGLNREPQPTMYIPNPQVPDAVNALNLRLTPVAWIVRAPGDPVRLAGSIQDRLREVSNLPVSDIRTMDEVVSRSTSRQRFNMLLMAIFGGSALLLAAIGVYSLMSYVVEQRRQEIGLRMALGAEATSVRTTILLQGLSFAIIGVIAGTLAAFALARLIVSFLFGVKPWDAGVFAGVPLLLTVIALVASLIPAIRATKIDPIIALKYE